MGKFAEYFGIGVEGEYKGQMVRFFYQELDSRPNGPYKVVAQLVGPCGEPDAVHPILLTWVDSFEEFKKLLDASKNFVIKEADYGFGKPAWILDKEHRNEYNTKANAERSRRRLQAEDSDGSVRKLEGWDDCEDCEDSQEQGGDSQG